MASLRCSELKDEALDKVLPMILELKEASETTQVENFAGRCRMIVMHAAAHFDEYGRHYDKRVYLKVRKELISSVLVQ